MNLVKKHWVFLALVAVFIIAVYYAADASKKWVKQAALSAAIAAAVLAFLTGGGISIIIWAFAVYAANWVLGFIPGSDGWYSKLPRKQATTDFSAGT
jgi:hypothetical protein